MKQIAIMLCLSVCTITGIAQKTNSPKPSLFSSYPSTINLSENTIKQLFAASEGQIIDMAFEGNFKLHGPVISKISKYNNSLQTMVVKLPAFNNILFSISKIVENEKSTIFRGHLFNSRYADSYELKCNASKQYQLIKIETEQLLQPCVAKVD